ncbi:MAG: terpene cyclase/mutase family protein [Victivallales bacterium]|nr:terpene cyclase/mutase family protein [Victivallales bacterium]
MDNNENTSPLPEQQFDSAAVLAEYQHRKMVESMVGPGVSLVIHLIIFVCIAVFYDGKPPQQYASVELEMKELEVKELDKQELEKLEELEEIAEEVVPTVERPTLSVDADTISDAVASVDDFSDAIASTDEQMDFSNVLDIRANDSPLKLSSLYGGRTDAGARKQQLKKFGGNDATELAVIKALRWLKETQNPDGSWAPLYKPAMAGLGLLTFLAHGETPASEEFGPTVQKALQYLINYTNNFPDDVKGVKNGDVTFPYVNGIVAYALSEAYGLTKLPNVKPAMEKSLKLVVDGQQPSGGYDYAYRKNERWDLSVTGWQLQAMKAGYVSGSENTKLERAIEKGISFLKNVSFDKKNVRYPFGYSAPGGGGWGMQGAGTLCLQLLGEGNSKEAKAGCKTIVENHLPQIVWNDPKRSVAGDAANPLYHWYYETQAMFHAGQTSWKKWNAMFSKMLIASQKPDGHWDCPPGKPDPKGNTVTGIDKWYTTTLCCLSLQVYYRYLPSYKMPKGIVKVEKTALDNLDEQLGLEL